MHRDLQLLSFEESKDDSATPNIKSSNAITRGGLASRKDNVANSKLKKHNEEISAQLEQTKGERLILSIEV